MRCCWSPQEQERPQEHLKVGDFFPHLVLRTEVRWRVCLAWTAPLLALHCSFLSKLKPHKESDLNEDMGWCYCAAQKAWLHYFSGALGSEDTDFLCG